MIDPVYYLYFLSTEKFIFGIIFLNKILKIRIYTFVTWY